MTTAIETFGWDTAFAVRYPYINNCITNCWSTTYSCLSSLNNTVDSIHLIAQLGPWQLIYGGSNSIVFMNIPFLSGTVSGDIDPLDVSGATATVEVSLKYATDLDDNNIKHLIVDGTSNTTIVREISLDGASVVYTSVISAVFSDWFLRNISAFNFPFHDINLSSDIYSSSQWLYVQPNAPSYAVIDGITIESSVFGALCMIGGDTPPEGNPHMISIQTIPDGSNSGFLLAGQVFVREHLYLAAGTLFEQPESISQSSDPDAAFRDWVDDNFEIINGGMTVSNKDTMKFGTVVDDKNQHYDLLVDRNHFRLSILRSVIEISFGDLYFEYTAGLTVYITARQTLLVDLKDTVDENGEAKKVFHLSCDQRNCEIVVVKSREEVITEIMTTICIAMSSALLGGLLGGTEEAISKASKFAVEAVQETAYQASTAFLSDLLANTALELVSDVAAACVAELVPGKPSSMTGFFAKVTARLFGSLLSSIHCDSIDTFADFVELAANGNYKELPPFSEYCEGLMKGHKWPDEVSYEVKSLELNTSLRIGGDIKA